MSSNIFDINYNQTGKSKSTNTLGMREMQERAFEKRNSKHLLIKAPPASGKSRALMFIGLDKLINQGLKKVIVAVPERSIGSSFKNTDLTSHGFFSNWEVEPRNNLTSAGGDKSKVQGFIRFMESDEKILVCTHATLRFAFEQLEDSLFDDCLLAIDEFHHVSADVNSKLGELLRSVLRNSTCHVVAMTGSYFRGDSVPILEPQDEELFDKVTYTYYEQLDGYEYLKSFGIGYHFYQGKYLSAINEVLDTDKKTIIHIPNVNSIESTKDKEMEVDQILDLIGEVEEENSETGILNVRRHSDGKVLKIADLVRVEGRDRIVEYLRNTDDEDDMDIIIALGMAKEGFDWPYCEHALTIGYRGSLTEIVQIIGRCTRDSSNKTHAQFTNLIAQPDAKDDDVTYSVNTMLKAISASLLMEQVLTPDFKFKARKSNSDRNTSGELHIKGFKEPSTINTKKIIENDLNDLKATIFQDSQIQKAMVSREIDPKVLNKVLIPKVIQEKYPNLTDSEVEEVRQTVVADNAMKNSIREVRGSKEFIRMTDKFVNIEDLNIDLIDSINPFQKAYEVLSKELNAPVLRLIQESIDAKRIKFDEEELKFIWPKVESFFTEFGKVPDEKSTDPIEKRMGEAVIYMRDLKRRGRTNG
ncbi:DEAD/DEAH box helicase [Enterococcus faecalis]|uniref:DEAD/DEAH box helicase n=1 Tax=Enterococcus faecalis TaxID=1351 RepID=UPI000CF29A75|nr:DEAD/DEAH box helicase [Enterococcus faecalis]EGP5710187.1 ATP-dependent helicase [Enterococcus faecium]EGO2644868.1 DEAD/DEAH box helicase family protein [Enterococcus faecalis]EGO8254433.1 DEAD/DEAH box helicase family protein [Enterococcus faecalis]EGO8512978.1 ATP-dependent helicase [Enterococcus faecalis]EHZ2967471.1 DEAD/DEAH box helicase family protein [Enterococcus faecalis]